MGSNTVSGEIEINQPTNSPPAPKYAPSNSTIVCDTTDYSTLYFDCVHAFRSNDFRDRAAHKGKKGEDHWEAVSSFPTSSLLNLAIADKNRTTKPGPSMSATTKTGPTTAKPALEMSWTTHQVSSATVRLGGGAKVMFRLLWKIARVMCRLYIRQLKKVDRRNGRPKASGLRFHPIDDRLCSPRGSWEDRLPKLLDRKAA
jgi:hypothetical protein